MKNLVTVAKLLSLLNSATAKMFILLRVILNFRAFILKLKIHLFSYSFFIFVLLHSCFLDLKFDLRWNFTHKKTFKFQVNNKLDVFQYLFFKSIINISIPISNYYNMFVCIKNILNFILFYIAEFIRLLQRFIVLLPIFLKELESLHICHLVDMHCFL